MKKTVTLLLITYFTITSFSYSMHAPTEHLNKKTVTPISNATYFKVHYTNLCEQYKVTKYTICKHCNHSSCPDHEYLTCLMKAPSTPFSRIITFHDSSWGIIYILDASRTDLWGEDFKEYCIKRLDPQSKPRAYKAEIFYCQKTMRPAITFFDREGESLLTIRCEEKYSFRKIKKIFKNHLDLSELETNNNIVIEDNNSGECILF